MWKPFRRNPEATALRGRFEVLELVVRKHQSGEWPDGFNEAHIEEAFARHSDGLLIWLDAEAYLNILKSLVETGELRSDTKHVKFWFAPKAIATLAEYQVEERRHRDSVQLQVTLVVLTAFIAFGTVVPVLVTILEAIFG